MNKITIHRALSELKLIDSKIDKSIQSLQPTGVMQSSNGLVNNFHKKEDFELDAESKFQSINDLLNRKVKIKSLIVQSNSNTKVTVGGKEMTVADAITFKSQVEKKKEFIDSLNSKLLQSRANVSQNNDKVEQNALRLAEAALQKDNVKINDNDAIAITQPYLDKNRFQLVDPLKVDIVIEKMTDEVDEFESEVDAVLSESNATTFIEI